MIIDRVLSKKIKDLAQKLPVVSILGPRQSGKTTISRETFPNHKYISLENTHVREFAIKDPQAFLKDNENEFGIILDEVQEAPEILSYIQTHVDLHPQMGYFILTGPQNFLINEKITQTLAGRVAIFTLLPLSINELKKAKLLPPSLPELIFKGFYPRIFAYGLEPNDWYPNYIQTYIQRDVRQIKNITNLSLFHKFVSLCAGRIGQILNITSLANDCGTSVQTIKSWLSLLEASYIIFLLQPHYKNFSKRLIKSPKIYFYDTGLACSLLGIDSYKQLLSHYLYGGLFESMVISEIYKYFYNQGKIPRAFFWRDKSGHEIDCLIEKAQNIIRIEIKAGKTISSDYFNGLNYWNNLAKEKNENSFVIYGGDNNQTRSVGSVIGWKNIKNIFE